MKGTKSMKGSVTGSPPRRLTGYGWNHGNCWTTETHGSHGNHG